MLCGTKRAGAEGAPRRKGGEGHPRAEFWRRARLELGCSWRAGWAPGEAGLVPASRAIRSASGARRSPFLSRRHFTFIPFHPKYYYYYYFPAQSGNLGLPERAAEGPPFPGESAARVGTGRPGKETGGECPAPNPPPHRPGARRRPRRPAHRAAAPDPSSRGPRPRPDLLWRGPPPDPGLFPPPGASAPLPLSARSSRRPTWAPSEAPRAALPGLSRPLRRPPPPD